MPEHECNNNDPIYNLCSLEGAQDTLNNPASVIRETIAIQQEIRLMTSAALSVRSEQKSTRESNESEIRKEVSNRTNLSKTQIITTSLHHYRGE